MIGLIIAGHGNFATGLNSALELIAGPQKECQLVDFVQEDTVDDLSKKLHTAMSNLSECDAILVLSDLPGGSPFKTAVEVGLNYHNVRVLGGVNMPLVCEVAMARNFMEDIDSLVDMAINTGQSQVVKFELAKRQEAVSDDGI